ncbi:hypothetical protein GW915_07715, partial [bacterium]|nr:hypothetical protein [bacterium]
MKWNLVGTVFLSFLFVACGKETTTSTNPSPSDPIVAPDDAEAVKLSFALLPADESQCSEGGTLIAT